MSGHTISPIEHSAADALSAEESVLRALFSALPDAMAEPQFGVAFAHYLRRRMQRLHPPGKADVRQVRSRTGLVFSIDLGDRFAAEIYYGQFAEPFELALMAALGEPDSVIVDVGANFGLYAATCGRSTDLGRDGCVLALEPAPSVLPLLRQNLESNGLADRVEVIPACAGEADGETEFHVAAESSLSGISATGRSAVAEVVAVPMRSLSSLLRERGQERLDLLKVDVEGHEHAVLRGALPLFETGSVIAMIEVSAKNLDKARRQALTKVLERLYEAGYVGRWYDPAEDALRAAETPQAAAALTGASLFLARRDSDAERRLLAAEAGVRTGKEEGPTFVPLLSPSVADHGSGIQSGHLHDRLLVLAVHLRRERERNVELSERIAEREWLERGMERIAGSEQRILDQIRESVEARDVDVAGASPWRRIRDAAARALAAGRR